MEDRFVALHIQKVLNANWKVSMEAFIESYHIAATHPQLVDVTYDEGTQVDIFSDNVSRFITLQGLSSPRSKGLDGGAQMQRMATGARGLLKDLQLKDGESARIGMARILRGVLEEKYRVDLSGYTDTDIIDNSNYSIFPNTILKPQLSLPLVYRFLPLGDDQNRTLFELFVIPPKPDGEPHPEASAPFRLEEHESFTSAPGFEPTLGRVFDQDTGNVRAQQEGLHASAKRAITLLNYNEARIRLQHQTLDKYIYGIEGRDPWPTPVDP
jgi:phenylpropionate dioxygenase-like ring-hydroxylating dioxygenase large terminal subunit